MNGIPEPYLAIAQEEGDRNHWQDATLLIMLEAITLSLETEYEERRKRVIKIERDHFKSCCPITSVLSMHKRKFNTNIYEPYGSIFDAF